MKVVGGEVVMLVSGTIWKWSSVGSGDELDESNRSVCAAFKGRSHLEAVVTACLVRPGHSMGGNHGGR
jgi:hypothetical protein